MTLTQKIIAAKSGNEIVKSGELVTCDVDIVLGNDITAPVAIHEFSKHGFSKVFDKEKIVLVMDHFTPNKDIASAENVKLCRQFARNFNIEHFFEIGCGKNHGIEHTLLPEEGLVTAGDFIIGADSHTCTYGALGAFSTGSGSTDMAAAMYSGKMWVKVPSAIKINMTGKPADDVCGKDIILHIIGKIGVDGALYKSLEFVGEGVSYLSMDDRFTMANMAVEAGAKNGIFETDSKTLEFLSKTGAKTPAEYKADSDDDYEKILDFDLSKIKRCVALPSLPSNVKNAEDVDLTIQQVVIGSCTNGRISDLRDAANVLKDKKVAPGVRCIIIPATQAVWKQALKEGLLEIFTDSGCIISPPTCGPCLGGHMGILAKGERAAATTNRNFVGRMGSPQSEVVLCSPITAALAALNGRIS
jgi:3-isopropylmalate/(R)-2-methylmalate dehydratase large subunit